MRLPTHGRKYVCSQGDLESFLKVCRFLVENHIKDTVWEVSVVTIQFLLTEHQNIEAKIKTMRMRVSDATRYTFHVEFADPILFKALSYDMWGFLELWREP